MCHMLFQRLSEGSWLCHLPSQAGIKNYISSASESAYFLWWFLSHSASAHCVLAVPKQCAWRHGATPGVLVLLGRAEVHLFLWAGSASAWTLLLAAEAGHLSGTLAVLFRPYTCTPQQSKPLLYEPPAMLCLNLSKPQAKSLVASNPDCSSWGWAQQGGSIAFSY